MLANNKHRLFIPSAWRNLLKKSWRNVFCSFLLCPNLNWSSYTWPPTPVLDSSEVTAVGQLTGYPSRSFFYAFTYIRSIEKCIVCVFSFYGNLFILLPIAFPVKNIGWPWIREISLLIHIKLPVVFRIMTPSKISTSKSLEARSMGPYMAKGTCRYD